MGWDTGHQALLAADLAGHQVTQKRMFGALVFMVGGHMVCGVHQGGAMFRLGQGAQALAIAGTAPMTMAGRPMAGFVTVGPEVMADDTRRGRLLALALAHAAGLPPRPPAVATIRPARR